MNGIVLLLAALAVFIAAALGILASSIYMFRFAGMALNKKRPVAQRRVRGLLAAACFFSIFGAATAGYLAIVALMYEGMRTTPVTPST